ncbi:MAG: FAD-dependent monooxygenase [Idiomarina sp.]|nr:FAD-dependent monooxygenase [Idiomarina sp.]
MNSKIEKSSAHSDKASANDLDTDICVSGGGVVGGLAALLSAQARPDLSITVLDASPAGQQDPRTLALARTTILTLQRAGVDTTRLVAKTAEIQHIHVSERGGAGSTTLHAATYDLPSLGKVVSAQVLQEAILAACQQHPNISWRSETSLQSVAYETDKVNLRTQGKQAAHISTKLLVAADGGRSMIRQQLKIARREEDYGQTALIANLTLDRDHMGWAYERFTEHGPIALLPCGARQMALVWCVPSDSAERYRELQDADFLAALQSEFGFRAGRFSAVSGRASYPLYLLLAERAVFHRTLLIGNACHTLHPIAGQGYNLGVRDCVDFARLIGEQASADGEVAHRALLEYERQRQSDYKRIAGLTDGLVRVFSNQHAPLVAARNLGLLALRKHSLLSYPLARAAMGYRNLLGER